MPPSVSMVLCLKHPGTKGTVGRASLPTCKGVKPQEIGGIFTQKNKAHVWISPSWWDSTLCGGLNRCTCYVWTCKYSVKWSDLTDMFRLAWNHRRKMWAFCNFFSFLRVRGYLDCAFDTMVFVIIRGVPLICYNLCAVVCMDVGIW